MLKNILIENILGIVYFLKGAAIRYFVSNQRSMFTIMPHNVSTFTANTRPTVCPGSSVSFYVLSY